MSLESLRESRRRAAYPGRQILQPVATSSRDGGISDLHDPLAQRDGYTKFGNRVGSNHHFFCLGSGSTRAVDFSIFSVVVCTPQEFFRRFGEYSHEIAGPRDFEMRGQQTTICTFCTV